MLTALNAGASPSARRARRFVPDVVSDVKPPARSAVQTDAAVPGAIRICHVMTADLWAGAEVQVAAVLSYLSRRPELHVSAVLFNDGRLARELRLLGIEVVILDERRLSAFDILIRLARFFRERPVDIVHTHRYKDTILGTIAAKCGGVPHVVRTMHGLAEPTTGWDRVKWCACDTLDKLALWCAADRIIAVSKHMAETLKTSGYKRTSVTYIHNGVDLSRLRPTKTREQIRTELGITPRTLLVGTAGRLAPVKAHDCLLRAARLILREEHQARFLIVGDGPLRDELVALADELGVRRECLFTGARADVQDLISAVDIFVLPSLAEGIPMALLEAMALGRPVVATAVGGVPEIVTHGSNGLLIDPGDEQALADACLDLACGRTRAQAIGASARETIEKAFSHASNGRAVVDTYRDVVSGPALRAAGRPYNLDTWTLCRELARGLMAYGWRRISHPIETGIERRRMNRIRRSPAALTAALRSAHRILIVCHGNIIRSAFAARLVTQAVTHRAGVAISSAGLAAVPGKAPHPTAVRVATALDVDLSAHAASPVSAEAVVASDAIFVMEADHLVTMRKRFPEARAKTFLLTCLAADTPLEIEDPFAGDEPQFRACFDHISRAVTPIVQALSQKATGGPGEQNTPDQSNERLPQVGARSHHVRVEPRRRSAEEHGGGGGLSPRA